MDAKEARALTDEYYRNLIEGQEGIFEKIKTAALEGKSVLEFNLLSLKINGPVRKNLRELLAKLLIAKGYQVDRKVVEDSRDPCDYLIIKW